MAHINSIAAAVYTDLSVAIGTVTAGKAAAALPAGGVYSQSTLEALFTTATSNCTYLRLKNVREFPPIGATPNIVNVPVYGQKQSQSVGGQSDAPQFQVTVNYVPADWAAGTTSTTFTNGVQGQLGSEFANMVGDGIARIWRLTLLATPPTAVGSATLGPYDSKATALGTVQNSEFYFLGKLESLQVTPSLTDAATATLAFSLQSDLYGAYTAAA